MKALSIKQPWADAILFGPKRVENRTWSPRDVFSRIIVHTGQSFDKRGQEWLDMCDLWPSRAGALNKRGGYLGVIEVLRFLPPYRWLEHDPWRDLGQWGWQIGRVVAFSEMIPGKGQIGLWTPPPDVVAHARELWDAAIASESAANAAG
jgi:hypothetical protein